MFRKTAGAMVFAAMAFASAAESRSDSIHSPFVQMADCQRGMFNNCFGADRDLLVDRLYRVSCGEARDILDDRGFTRIKTVSCGGHRYKFTARWKGSTYRISVSRSTGDVVSMKHIN